MISSSDDPMAPVDLSVVVPAYDAAHCVAATLERICGYLNGTGLAFEVIAVDDGSRDETWDLIAAAGRRFPQVAGVRLDRNRGKGRAVREGMFRARGRRRLFLDADGSTDISALPAALARMEEGCDVVIASRCPRDVPGACQARPQGLVRRWMGRAGNVLIRLAGVRGIHDTQCGFKLYTSKAAGRLFALSAVDRWAFDVEILLLARRMGLRVGIIPVEWRHDPRSAVRPVDYPRTLLDLARIRLRLARGRYRW